MLAISNTTKHLDLNLHKGEIITLRDIQRGFEIECRQGALWITRTGDEHDYTLQGGEHFKPGHSGKIIIQAIQDADLVLNRN